MNITSTMAGQAYAANRSVTAPTGSAGGVILDAAKDFAATLEQSEAAAKTAMTGNGDPHQLVLSLAQTELAVEAVVTIRDKVVEAYQEILRMPV